MTPTKQQSLKIFRRLCLLFSLEHHSVQCSGTSFFTATRQSHVRYRHSLSEQEMANDFNLFIKTVEMHTGGEPFRIVHSGYPHIEGENILEKRRYVEEKLDYLRRMLIFEPRGHYDMYGAVLIKPDLTGADIGVLFLHNEGYSTMCGHGVIALGRFAVDHGYVKYCEPYATVNIQCPCGLVPTTVECRNGKTGRVSFKSVPAFVFATDYEVEVSGFSTIKVDISYGGAFYAFIEDQKLGLDVTKSSAAEIREAAMSVSNAIKEKITLEHPDESDLAFLYGTIVTRDLINGDQKGSVNVCTFAEKQIDRSPCGSGVTALAALQYHKGLVGRDETREYHNGLTGSIFTGKVVQETMCGDFSAVTVEVGGQAYYTGEATYSMENEDKLGQGFLLR